MTSPAPRDVWTGILAESPDALAFQTPVWLDCICETGGYEDVSRLYETSDGGQLVLPMVRRTRLLGALAIESSLPAGWGFGGFVTRAATRPEDAAAALSELAGHAALRSSVRVRPTPLTAATWAAAAPAGAIRVPRLAHVLDLEGGFEQVWARRFTGSARTAVRKAERAGLTVECDTSGRLVPVYYDLYMRSIERWAGGGRTPLPIARWRGRRRDPLRKLQLITERLGDACRIWLASLDGRPAAAIIVLLQGRNASYWRGAMDEASAGPTRANYLLHSRAIEDACRAGCLHYHMGETGSSASLAQFKSRFGAAACEYAEYRLERLPITELSRRVRTLERQVIGTAHALLTRPRGERR
ncbi:MAG: GNAT family N-acetyltransferase [Gemmatimonadaceae bacterium]